MKYVLQRIGAMLLTLFMVMSLSFMVIRLMPMSLFENPEVPKEIQEKLEDKFHLNDPLPVQYFYFMEGIVTGLDFGISVKLRPGLDVWGIIVSRLPPTMLINFISLFISIPLGLMFILTTNPSEFAASLNRVGVSYKISYAVALALRYIPDIQREYRDISLAQQARGTEMSKKASLVNRLKAASTILIPLILSSMDRIETISNAMELRGFGKSGKRTWYSGKKFSKMDILCIILCVALMALSLLITFLNGSRYYNPFM